MNNVNLIGRLTVNWDRNDNSTRLSAQIAVNGYKDHTDFIPIVYLNEKNMDNIENSTHKGSLIGVSGRVNSYKNKEEKTVINIVASNIEFLEPKNSQGSGNTDSQPSNDDYVREDDSVLWE